MSFFCKFFWALLLLTLLAILFYLGYGDFLLEPVDMERFPEFLPPYRLP